MRRTTAAFAMLGLMLAAFVAGRWTVAVDASPSEARVLAPEGGSGARVPAAGGEGARNARAGTEPTEIVLRRVVREELAAALAMRPPSPPPGAEPSAAGPAPTAPEASPEERAAAAPARAALREAVARRRWTVGDGERWQELVATLAPAARIEVEREFILAINTDQLAVDAGAYPLGPAAGR